MSDHAVEDLVEASIRALDGSRRDPLEIRDGIALLLRYQARFDCSFTHFRVIDILLRREHTVVVPIEKHPAYPERGAILVKALARRECTFIASLLAGATDATDEGEDEDDEGHVGDGYLRDGKLYCDIGTPLWKALRSCAGLPIASAPALRERGLAEVVAWVAEGAANDPKLVLAWYEEGPGTLFADTLPREFTLDELRAVPQATVIREAGLRARTRVPARAEAAPAADPGADAAREAWAARRRALEKAPGFTELQRIDAWWKGQDGSSPGR